MNLESCTKKRFGWYELVTGLYRPTNNYITPTEYKYTSFGIYDKSNLCKYWRLYNDTVRPVIVKVSNDIAKPVDLKEEDFNHEIDIFMGLLGEEKSE